VIRATVGFGVRRLDAALYLSALLAQMQKRRQAGALQNLAASQSLMYHRSNRKKNIK